jgi:hypothetical protein
VIETADSAVEGVSLPQLTRMVRLITAIATSVVLIKVLLFTIFGELKVD